MAQVAGYVREALADNESTKDASVLARLPEAMGGVAFDARDERLAAELLGALRDSLGEDAFAERWQAGVALDAPRLLARLGDAIGGRDLIFG